MQIKITNISKPVNEVTPSGDIVSVADIRPATFSLVVVEGNHSVTVDDIMMSVDDYNRLMEAISQLHQNKSG